MNPYQVLLRPVITEKSSLMTKDSKYLFEVDRKATKLDVKRAIKVAFDVDVVSVNTINVKGKVKNYRGRPKKLSDTKRAIVKLKENQSIPIFDGV